MAEQFYTILTNIGKASIANATALGGKVDFKYMALGDGNGSYYNPTETQTELKNEVYRTQINHVQLDEENLNWVTLTIVVPTSVGGFTVREVGAFDTEGNLLVIGKYPETYKPKLEEGSGKDLTVNMILEVSNTSVVNLKIDPTVILATKKDIDILSNRITKNETDMSELKTDLDEHKADLTQHKDANLRLYRLNRDSEGIFTELQWKRPDGTLAIKSVLSGGTSPKYTKRTETYYENNGTTIKTTKTYALSYNTDDELISEV